MDFGMGMGMAAGYGGAAAAAAAPFVYSMPAAMEALRVDDLLDFSNNDIFSSSSSSSSSVAADANIAPAEQFTAAAAAVSNSDCHYPYHAYFADDIYIPSDEVAELEWLSNFVEDSFSYAPFQSLAANPTAADAPALSADLPVVGRGIRSKRSRGNVAVAAAADSAASSSSSSDFPTPKGGAGRRKHVSPEAAADGSCPAGTRRCTHCASEKTPQWRTGPLGPKTLCNACGVRYKSGRLVPEYRPAASPTFVLTQHSNSHRKVMELRRQKEILILRRQENTSASAAVRPEMLYSDYDVC